MTEQAKCAECGKDAIGIQSFGCRTSVVCRNHAHNILRALRPGQEYTTGDCSFMRFCAEGMTADSEADLLPDCQ